MKFAKYFDQHWALTPRGDNIFHLFLTSAYYNEDRPANSAKAVIVVTASFPENGNDSSDNSFSHFSMNIVVSEALPEGKRMMQGGLYNKNNRFLSEDNSWTLAFCSVCHLFFCSLQIHFLAGDCSVTLTHSQFHFHFPPSWFLILIHIKHGYSSDGKFTGKSFQWNISVEYPMNFQTFLEQLFYRTLVNSCFLKCIFLDPWQ